MQKIVDLTVFYKWWGLNVYLPNTFKSDKVLWNNRIITSNRKKLKPTHPHDHKQNHAFKFHKQMNKYLLKIPPWFRKGMGNTANILGINKSNLDKICKVNNNECKNKTVYKCMRNKFFGNSSKPKRDNVNYDLIFGYSNTSLKNIKSGTYVKNEIPLKKHSSIENKCEYYESVFGGNAVSQSSTQNSDAKNDSLVYEKDGHHHKELTDGDLKYYLENYSNENVQSVPKTLRLNDNNNMEIPLSDFVQKDYTISKNSECLLLHYNALSGQEINIKINLRKLWSTFSNKSRQIIKAGGILRLNCKFPILASKPMVSSDKPIKHKTIFYLNEVLKASNDSAVEMKGTKEGKIDSVDKIGSLTNTKYTNNGNSNEYLNSSFPTKLRSATTRSFNISDNDLMTLSLQMNSSNDETGNTNAQENKVSKAKKVQNKQHKYEKLEHLNDEDHTEMILTSNISKYENRNLMSQVKMKISDTSSNDHIGELAELPENYKLQQNSKKLQRSKPKKITKCITPMKIEDRNTLSGSNINPMQQKVEEGINGTEESTKNDQRHENKYIILLKTENRNQNPKSNTYTAISKSIEEGSQTIDNNKRALLKIEDKNKLSDVNINSKLEKEINRTQISKNDEVVASKCLTPTKIEDGNTPSGININSKDVGIVKGGITIIEDCEKNYQFNECERTDILEKQDGISLSESNINLKMKQNDDKRINGTGDSTKNDQLHENKYIILLKTGNRNQIPKSNTNSMILQNMYEDSQTIDNNNRVFLKIEDKNKLPDVNINSKLEKEINRTQIYDQVNASKCLTPVKIEDRKSPSGTNINSKDVGIVKGGITIIEYCEKHYQFNECKRTDILEKQKGFLLSQSNINLKMNQNVEDGINGTGNFTKDYQLHNNKYVIVQKTENRNPILESNAKSKISQKIDEGSQNIENYNRALLKIEGKNTLSAAIINCKLAQKFEEGINIIEGTEKSGKLKENKCTAPSSKNENENKISESTINSKVSQSVEQGINRYVSSEQTDQLKETKFIALSLKNENKNKLPESTINPKVMQSVEQGYGNESSEQRYQLKENKFTALSLNNENEIKLSESNINPNVTQSVEQGINRTETSEQTHQLKENKFTALSLQNENKNKLRESTNNPKISQIFEQGYRNKSSEQTDQLKENKFTALSLNNENEIKLSESNINPNVTQSVEQGINRTETSEQTHQLKENKFTALSLQNENKNKLRESTNNPKISQIFEQGNRNKSSEQTDQLKENKFTALSLNNENENKLSESNINPNESQSVEQGNRNESSELTDQLKENKFTALSLQNENKNKLRESTNNPKISQIFEQGNRNESSELTDQLKENKFRALSLNNENENKLSESNINPNVSQSVEQGNRNESSELTDQLKENKFTALSLQNENKNKLPELTINPKVSQSVEQGNRNESSEVTDQLKENKFTALSLQNENKNKLRESTNNPKISQIFEQGNRNERSELTDQLKENKFRALSLNNENENKLSESNINPNVSQSVEQGNRNESSELTDQLKENKFTGLSLKNENENKLPESNINPNVSQSVEQGNRNESSELTDQLKENKFTGLSLKNENENKLPESNINPNVSQSVEQGNRNESSELTDQLKENKFTGLSLKNENENKLPELTINPKVSQSVEQGNRNESSELTDQLKENKFTGLSLKNENENKLPELTINPKVSQSVEQGINRTNGSKHTDQVKENKFIALSLKNENENKFSESNINSVVRRQAVEKVMNRRENTCSVCDDDIGISSVCSNSQSGQNDFTRIKMMANPPYINIKLQSLVKNVLCAAKDNESVIHQTKGSEVNYTKTDSTSSGTDTQTNISQKTEKNNRISCESLTPDNAIKNVNISYIGEKLLENSYNLSQSKTHSEETRNEFRKRLNEGEKLIKTVHSIVDNKINNCVQHNKKMKPSFRKRHTNNSVHDSDSRTSAVRKSVEQNIKSGTNIILDLNTYSEENYNVVNENNLNKKCIPPYCERKLYNCASRGSPSERLFEQSKTGFGNSMALAELHATRCAERKQKVVSKHLKKEVYPDSLLTAKTAPHKQHKKAINIVRPKGNHLSGVSGNLRTKSKLSLLSQTKLLSTMSQNKSNDYQKCSSISKGAKETRYIPASPSSMTTQISELPKITKKKPIIVSGLKEKIKESDSMSHNESDPNSYKPLSRSPCSIMTKLTQLKVSKLKKKINTDGGLNDESEPTACNANPDQFNNTKEPCNWQSHVDRNDKLNQSLLHTNNVKQEIFKCPDADDKCKINLSGNLKNKLDNLKELFNNNLNYIKEKWEISNASRKQSKPTVCPSNTVLKMLQQKTLSRKKKQVKVIKQRYCIPSYSEVVKSVRNVKDD